MSSQRKDILECVFMAFVALCSIYLFLETNKIAPPEYEILGPAFAPKILVCAVGGFAGFLSIQKLIFLIRSDAPNEMASLDDGARAAQSLSRFRFVALLLLLGAFVTVFALKAVPYWISASLFLMLGHLILSTGTKRQIVLSVVVAAITVSANYALATNVFDKVLF